MMIQLIQSQPIHLLLQSLLMPKVIAPRRTSKNITAEEYWNIKSQLKKEVEFRPINYREDQVERRHRYTRPSQQAKLFNPLLYFLEKKTHHEIPEHTTHTHSYLETIAYRLPEKIAEVKGLMFGLASILKNLSKIYHILWENLHLEDSWLLLQALLKDTRGQCYDLWLQEGFQKLTKEFDTTFHLMKFRNFFNTICTFMDTFYNKIIENQQNLLTYFQSVGSAFFVHQNKYLKHFSLQCSSYILGNLQDSFYHKFLTTVHNHQNLSQFLSDLLAYRLKYSQGCFTPKSLQEMIEIINQLHKKSVQQHTFTEFIFKIIRNLNNRIEEAELIYDLGDVLKVLVGLINEEKIPLMCLTQALVLFFEGESQKKRKSQKIHLKQSSYEQVSTIFFSKMSDLSHNSYAYQLLVELVINCPENFLKNAAQVTEFLQQEEEAENVIIFLEEVKKFPPEKDFFTTIIFSLKGWFKRFINIDLQNDEQLQKIIEIVYRLLLVLKNLGMNMEYKKLLLEQNQIINKIDEILKITEKEHQYFYEYSLVYLKLLSAIMPSLSENAHKTLIPKLKTFYKLSLVEKHENNLIQQLNKRKEKNLFGYEYFVEQIFIYAHHYHQGWLSKAFNLFQSFTQIQAKLKLKKNFISEVSQYFNIWQRIMVNRLSLVNQIYDNISQISSETFTILQSRHRTVRLSILTTILDKIQFTHEQQQILKNLQEIDSEIVDLQTQREVKRKLLESEKYLSQNLSEKVCKIIMLWSIGFSFTGFKLIGDSFQAFLRKFLEKEGEKIKQILMKFLEYYNFRNSRLFDAEIKKIFKEKNETSILSEQFESLLQQDFQIQKFDTVEFIGIDRIVASISHSEKTKKILSPPLTDLISSYFSTEFLRHKRIFVSLTSNSRLTSQQQNQLLPPKTTFLKQILKLTPSSYTSPIQCLHYTEEYLELSSIRKIKRHNWQILWEKKKKTEQQLHIDFSNMSIEEQEVYVNFLWGLILKSNTNQRRKIIEHIRDNLPQRVLYLMSLFYKDWLLEEQFEEKIERKIIFKFMNSRKLLTYIYILKSMAGLLKNYLQNEMEKILSIIVDLIMVVNIDQENENKMINEDDESMEEEEQQNVEEQQTKESSKKFRNHRKQIYKILSLLIEFYHEVIPEDLFSNVLHSLERNKKIQTLVLAAEHSLPGLLIFITKASQFKSYQKIILQFDILTKVSQIFANQKAVQQTRVIQHCSEILSNILDIKEVQMVEETEEQVIKIPNILNNIYQWLTATSSKKQTKYSFAFWQKMFKIIKKLMKGESEVQSKWQSYLWNELQRLSKQKILSQRNAQKISLLLKICTEYNIKSKSNDLAFKIVSLLPHLKDIQHRKNINLMIEVHAKHKNFTQFTEKTIEIASKINSYVDTGLVMQMNFVDFFDSIKQYQTHINNFTPKQHEYIVYNLLAYLSSEEMSVRKSVSSTISMFLSVTQIQSKDIVGKIARNIAEQLKKPSFSPDTFFYSVILCLSHFVRWIVQKDLSENYDIFAQLVEGQNSDKDVFNMICSLSQAEKMKGLKAIQAKIKSYEGEIGNKMGNKYPPILNGVIIPILEHLILPPVIAPNTQYHIQGNLSSTLTHICLEIYGQILVKTGISFQKKQLKRIISKLKFDDTQTKKNILLIKMIGQVIESIDLPKSTDIIKNNIMDNGFDEFHKKIVEKQSKFTKVREEEEDSDAEENEIKKAFTKVNNEVDDDEVINLNFLNFDKKMVQAQEISEQPQIIRFLRIHILVPLKTILMYENRSQKNSKEQTEKSRLLISVVLTKLICKFPVDIFLTEFQKIISKLGKLLKKRQMEIRENSRKCLSQIAKVVGPEVLYLICRQLKFHLRDNFQQHIFNYTVYFILQKLGSLPNGSLDHCLPILLPIIMDEIFGKSAKEKQMVEQNEIPTINMQSRKKKGNELLVFLCRQLSLNKIEYLIKYLQKFLKDFMNSEVNLSKYELMLNNLVGGLGKNTEFVNGQKNLPQIIGFMQQSMEEVKKQIKFYRFDGQVKHDSTVNQNYKKEKKLGSKEIFQLQEEAGRNGSIFRKQTKGLLERRNLEILVNCYLQFYLALLSLLVKKKIIQEMSLKALEETHQCQSKFKSILNFLIECLGHRENRIVVRCLKILHPIMRWENLKDIKIDIKKIKGKITKLILEGTGADEELQRQALIAFNDAYTCIQIKEEKQLQIALQIIKISIASNEENVIDEPYRLFETILLKIYKNQMIRNPEVLNMYNEIKVTLLNTTHDKIRKVCRDICKIFIRSKQLSQTPSHQKIQKSKEKSNTKQSIVKKQLSFFLNNLDCKYYETQQCVLDIINEYVQYCEKDAKQLEETGEVIIMSLGTLFANGDAENEKKIQSVIMKILSKIDKAKTLSLLNKCTVWMKNEQNKLISVCGHFLTQIVLLVPELKLSSEVLSLISESCLHTLNYECVCLEEYLINGRKQQKKQREVLKKNPGWENILMDDERGSELKEQKSFQHVIKIIKNLQTHNGAKLSQCKEFREIVGSLWKLLGWPEWGIFVKVKSILMEVKNISQWIGYQTILNIEKGQSNSLINTLLTILNNRADESSGSNDFDGYTTHIGELMGKIIEETNNIDGHEKSVFLDKLFSCLLQKINKSFVNLQKYEVLLPIIIQILKYLFTFNHQQRNRMLGLNKLHQTNENFKELLWNLAKIRRNDILGSFAKEKNQELGQIVGQMIGKDELLRRLAYVEAQRAENKKKEKVAMARLAVTNQEAFEKAKAKKRRKI